MSWEMRQTRRFARSCKKLQDYIVTEVDAAVAMIVQNPDRGEKKGRPCPTLGPHVLLHGTALSAGIYAPGRRAPRLFPSCRTARKLLPGYEAQPTGRLIEAMAAGLLESFGIARSAWVTFLYYPKYSLILSSPRRRHAGQRALRAQLYIQSSGLPLASKSDFE